MLLAEAYNVFGVRRHFIRLRSDPAAQWEIRELAHRILDILYEAAPSVFQDLVDARKTSCP